MSPVEFAQAKWMCARRSPAIIFALCLSVLGASRATAPAPGSVILRGRGPIEVSGLPESFAVAWVDEPSGTRDLSLAVYQEGVRPIERHLSSAVDRGQPILLSKHLEGVAVGWSAEGRWHLGVLRSNEPEDWIEATLDGPAVPIAMSLGREGLVILTTPAPGRGANPIAATHGSLALPALSGSALVRVDPARAEIAVVHEFPEIFAAGAVRFRPERFTVASVEPDAASVHYTEIDPSGRVVFARRLSAEPDPRIAPELEETSEGTFLAWVERGAERRMALMGRMGRADAGLEFRVESYGAGDVDEVRLSEGGGRWTAWREIGEAPRAHLARLDPTRGETCASELPAEGVERIWLLGDGQTARLFVQVGSKDEAELHVHDFACADTSGERTSTPMKVETPPAGQPDAVLGGAEEPCDGRDNDGDGTVDEGCDLICDNPQKAGSDLRVTIDGSSSLDASLVWTGSGYGVAWYDLRNGNYEIYFARLNSSGNKIGADVRVTNDAATSLSPSLVWTGNEYAIAWVDNRNGNNEIYFARLDAAGVKIGLDKRVTNNAASSNNPSLVWTGSQYGVSWYDNRNGNPEIYFAILDAAGNKGIPDVRVTNDASTSSFPSLAWSGTEYGVSWQDDRNGNYEIYFARLDAITGGKIGSDVRETSDASLSNAPSLVWRGGAYGVAWRDDRAGNPEIYFARLSSLGAKIGSDLRVTNDASFSGSPSLVWTGSEYGVSWYDTRDGNNEIYFARVNSTGTKIGSDVRVTSDGFSSSVPSLVWTGSGYGESWYDTRDGNNEIYFAPIRCCDDADADGFSECAGDTNDADPSIHPGALEFCDGRDNDSDGTVDEGCDLICDSPEEAGADVRVTNDGATSEIPSLVWTGGGYGMSWYDNRDGNYEIYFARVNTSGIKVGPDVRVTSDAAYSVNPSLVWTGTEYGVSWEDSRNGNGEIYFTRLDAGGNKIGADVRVTNVVNRSAFPSLVWTGGEYGVAWQDSRNGNDEIYFTRLDISGNKIGADVRVTNDAASSTAPSLIWTGAEYGVAWEDKRNGNNDVYFARLDALGNKIGADVRVTNDVYNSNFPSLVWTGVEYGVAWEDDRAWQPFPDFEIYFARLTGLGVKIGSDIRVTNEGSSSSASLVWTGTEYGVAWNDSREGSLEIYFARIGSTGAKIGSDVRVTNAIATYSDPSLVWTGSGYGVSWEDVGGNSEIYFAQIRCCDDADGDGFSECAGDSNDADPSIHPGAAEVCDGIDNDSDGTVDEGCDAICDSPEKAGADARVTNDGFSSSAPSLVWTGSGHGVSWTDTRDGNSEIYFGRLNSSGTKIGPDVRVTNNGSNSLSPSLVWTGSEYGVSWYDNRDGNYEIYFARLDASGAKIGSDVRVTSDASLSVSPFLVWTGSEYGVSWGDSRDGDTEIYFARLDAAGNKIGVDVRVTNSVGGSGSVSLVWTGNAYGVSWVDDRNANNEIYFARLDAAGNKIGADVRVTNDAASSESPSLDWTGNAYGVSWNDVRDGNFEIYFAKLNTVGTKIGADVRVTSSASNSLSPSLVWTGSEHGVSWHDSRDGNNEIYFARLDSAGTKIGSDMRVTNNVANSFASSVDWTGSGYAVSWYDSRDGNNEIYFAQIRCCDDVDGDGNSECHDCNDGDPSVWATPGEAQSVTFTTKTTLSWIAPVSPGGTAPLYDTIRSSQASDFSAAAVCLETDDGSDTSATDDSTPASGAAFYYLVRAGDSCGEGTSGTGANGLERSVRVCP